MAPTLRMRLARSAYRRLLAAWRRVPAGPAWCADAGRRLRFDLAAPGTLLLGDAGRERFVVAAGDRYIGRSVYVTGEPYDFDKMERVGRLLAGRLPGTLVDIGANIGTVCVPAVARGVFRRAVAVEPEPLNHALLAANVQLNRLGDAIRTVNVALDTSSGRLVFELSGQNFGDHRVRLDSDLDLFHERSRPTIDVPSRPLDDVAHELDLDPADALLWIDTQGHEARVLGGALEVLRARPPLVLEFWPYGLKRSDGFGPLKDLLVGRYRSIVDLNDPASREERLEPDTLDRLYRRLGEGHAATDLLLQ